MNKFYKNKETMMKKKLLLLGLIICLVTCLSVGMTGVASANSSTVQFENVKEAVLAENDLIDKNVERLNFDDLYLSSMTVFDNNNAEKSMFGGYLQTGRIESSFEISFDIEVLTAPDQNSNFGIGVKNVLSDAKLNLIKSGGYELLIGKNQRLEDGGITGTSLRTLSIVKNGALTQNTTSSVIKYAIFDLPAWLTLDEGEEFNLKVGAVLITDKGCNEIKGYYIYVNATCGENSDTVAEIYDYCDIESHIGGVATGIVSGLGQYKITTKNTDNVTTLEKVNSYDLMQLDQGTKSHYQASIDNKKMFGCAEVATDNSLEVNMKIIVEEPTTAWQTFSVGLKNCPGSLGGNYVFHNGGYTFSIGNSAMVGYNNYKTISIKRNGIYTGHEWIINAMKGAVMPDWLDKTLRTEGGSFKYTIGLRRITSGEEVLGYYAYMKANDQIILDFYDYFDYESNLDYFGNAFSGGIENAGSYTITTCGLTEKEFESYQTIDLSKLVPVTENGLTYTADKESKSTEKVISRYVYEKESLAVKYNIKYTGEPTLDLSLRGVDDGSKVDAVRFNLDFNNKTFRVYTIAKKTASFDSGDLDLLAVGLNLSENTEYLLEYGVIRYKYKDCAEYNRARLFIKIDGVDVYKYDYDYIGASVLGYYVGGRVIGDADDTVTFIPTEQNQLDVSITARTLKQSIKVNERNAIVYESTVPTGLNKVEYEFISGEDLVYINAYGVVTGLKEGTAKLKVKVIDQYGTKISNEITLTIEAAAQADNTLEEFVKNYNPGCAGSIGVIESVIISAVLIAAGLSVILIRRRKDNEN